MDKPSETQESKANVLWFHLVAAISVLSAVSRADKQCDTDSQKAHKMRDLSLLVHASSTDLPA